MINSLLFLLALISFGTVGFWIISSVIFIIISSLVDDEKYIVSSILILIYVGIYASSFKNIQINWQYLIEIISTYTLIGSVWSIYRWNDFVKNKVDNYKAERENNKSESDYLKKQKLENLQRNLELSRNRGHITAWIFYWPFSLLANISKDIIDGTIDALTSVYKRIIKHHMDKIEKI